MNCRYCSHCREKAQKEIDRKARKRRAPRKRTEWFNRLLENKRLEHEKSCQNAQQTAPAVDLSHDIPKIAPEAHPDLEEAGNADTERIDPVTTPEEYRYSDGAVDPDVVRRILGRR